MFPAGLKQFAGGEIADEAAVGGEEVITGEVAQITPAQIVEDVVGDFARKLVDGEELQIDCAAVAVGVPHMRDERADGGVNR